MSRTHIYWISRAVIIAVVLVAVGTLLLQPANLRWWLLDIAGRTYLMFLGTVMAHEGVHGHLGRTKAANFRWGCLALLPCMVPFTNFRKTHHLHHAYPNDPDRDPDIFLKSRHALEIPFRAVAMPHHWFFWLRARGRFHRADAVELALNYAGLLAVYAPLAVLCGPGRLAMGMLPALVGVSVLLWYPFAIKTHEGYSLGPAETRSHNYYGRPIYWLSLGLSMHREHHLQPALSWLELKVLVEAAPVRGWQRWLPRRHVLEPPSL